MLSPSSLAPVAESGEFFFPCFGLGLYADLCYGTGDAHFLVCDHWEVGVGSVGYLDGVGLQAVFYRLKLVG